MEEITLFGQESKEVSDTKHVGFSIAYKIKIVDIITLIFSILFMYSSCRKTIDFKLYKDMLVFNLQNLHAVKLVTLDNWMNYSLGLFILVELFTALLLLSNKHRRIGLYFSFFLTLWTTIYFIVILIFDHSITIFFGGIIPYLSYFGHFVLNLIILFVALIGITFNSTNLKLNRINRGNISEISK